MSLFAVPKVTCHVAGVAARLDGKAATPVMAKARTKRAITLRTPYL